MAMLDVFAVINISLMVVTCEALVQLWLHAAPIQGIRRWLIKATPFLYSAEPETHLLDCPYCLSVWVGFLMMMLYRYMDSMVFMLFVGALAVHRLSNFLHLVFSFVRDLQMDIRVNRRRKP